MPATMLEITRFGLETMDLALEATWENVHRQNGLMRDFTNCLSTITAFMRSLTESDLILRDKVLERITRSPRGLVYAICHAVLQGMEAFNNLQDLNNLSTCTDVLESIASADPVEDPSWAHKILASHVLLALRIHLLKSRRMNQMSQGERAQLDHIVRETARILLTLK